jgi:hydroxymethylpyrimidine pyrophosphatase-like HAD family hydrolase
MSENNLAAARAMARHMYNGGEMHDQTGTSITEMAGELNKLREFVRYVQSNNLVNEDNQNYVSLAFENIEHIKDTFKKLSGVKSYASAVNEVEKRSNIEMLEDDIDLEAKFTETHFDQRVEAVRDVIRTAMSRKSAFESSIDSAIKKESFDNLANMLSENDGIDFVSPRAKLGYQVSQLGSTVQNPQLGAYLSGISKKLQAGSHINQHEYTTIKSCLLGAHKTQPAVAVAESIDDKYEQFLEQFDIL